MHDNDWQTEIVLLEEREHKSRMLLGVSETADRDHIRRAFHQACFAHHPDVNGGDAEASRRFQLARCAYKFLTEGEVCAALDELDAPPEPHTDTKYRLDNPWGYWCWWRDTFFGDSP
jgi:DnaJ domain